MRGSLFSIDGGTPESILLIESPTVNWIFGPPISSRFWSGLTSYVTFSIRAFHSSWGWSSAQSACFADKSMEEETLNRLAAEELLRDAQRASDRAATYGATAWQRNPVPKTNKTFLTRALSGALTQNAWLSSKAQRPSPSKHSSGSSALSSSPRCASSLYQKEDDTMIDGLRLRDSDQPSSSRSYDEDRCSGRSVMRSPRKSRVSPGQYRYSPSKHRRTSDTHRDARPDEEKSCKKRTCHEAADDEMDGTSSKRTAVRL